MGNFLKKKKGQSDILMILFISLLFTIIMIIGIIMTYFNFAIGNDYVMLPLYNVSQSFNSSAQINAGYDTIVQNYQDTDLSFIDNGWFFGYMALVMVSLMIAYSSKSMNYFAFLSWLTYGLMFFLYVVGIFSVLANFLYSDILLNLFLNLAIVTPKLGWFIANYGWVFLLHATALLLIKVLDFDFATMKQRKKREIESINDDELV